MSKLIFPLILLFFSANAFAQSKSPIWTDVAKADIELMGDYIGSWLGESENSFPNNNPRLFAQVVNAGVGVYDIHLMQDLNRRAQPEFSTRANVKRNKLSIDEGGWNFVVSKDKIEGTRMFGEEEVKFLLERDPRISPTMGKKPPQGAIVLFDGSDFDEWEHTDGRAVTWNILSDGSMEIEPTAENKGADPKIGGGIRTVRKFKDVKFHMEFRYPVEPDRSGQGRGNSGLFFQGEYEAQVLNSYGLEGFWNQLGALYKHSAPLVNAARAPLIWQTYDVTYTAARFEEGVVVKNPRITVYLNGTLVQDDVELKHHTAHWQNSREDPVPDQPGPIMLQDHSNRIQFRNIWIKEL